MTRSKLSATRARRGRIGAATRAACFLGLALATVGALAPAAASATAAPAQRPQVSTSNFPAVSIAATAHVPGATKLFAVGTDETSSTNQHGVAFLSSGRTWSTSHLPSIASSYWSLGSITASSASDAWAAGQAYAGGRSQILLLHWNGTTWSKVTVKFPSALQTVNNLEFLTAVSRGSFVAEGLTSSGSYLVRFASGKWTNLTPKNFPSTGAVAALAASSPTNIWLAYYYWPTLAAAKFGVERYNGTWSTVKLPANLDIVASISVLASNDVWVGGSYADSMGSYSYPIMARYTGSKWVVQRQASSKQGALTGVGALSATDAAACGYLSTGPWFMERYNGTSGKLLAPLPSNLGNHVGVTSVQPASSTAVWAVASAWAGKMFASQEYAYGLYFNGTKWSATKL